MAKPIRILSLDGGGVRGISSLFILERLMEEIQTKLPGPEPTPKPSQYFDLIGGTSTGGIIAIMLGRLNMDVGDCLTAYRDLAKIAFVPRKKNFVLEKVCNERSCVSPATGEKKEKCPHAIAKKFRDAHVRTVLTTNSAVLAITKDNVNVTPTVFGTYHTTAEFENCTISQIARATSAATTFFPSIRVGRIERLEQEARDIFTDATEFYIVSIGTGTDGVVEIKGRRSIVEALKSLATTSGKVHSQMEERHRESDYSRFNVIDGLHDVTLSDWEESSRIITHTHNYIKSAAVKRQIATLTRVRVSGFSRNNSTFRTASEILDCTADSRLGA
ncbi:acyl transferase/acyl hydrolase/lysophospholipase [Nemania sp. FL0031]|nr:acyl transferase/acyl hydrolase/lysophospholipase [Nemania sp. FL0031]